MMKRMVSVVILLCMCISLGACDSMQGEKGITREEGVEQPITKVQMIEDYDAMWDALEENYPFWNAVERRGHVHVADVKVEYRKLLEDMDIKGDMAMVTFFEAIGMGLYKGSDGMGHASIVNANAYQELLTTYEKYVDEMPELQPWVDVLQKHEIALFYQYFVELQNRVIENQPDSGKDSEQQTKTLPEENQQNVVTKVLEEGKTAYIQVRSFEDSAMEEEVRLLENFVERVQDFDHLIIDIRGNSGGNSEYWERAFVKQNIVETVTVSEMRLLQEKSLAKKFYYHEAYQNSLLTIEDVISNPNFTELQLKDIETFSYVYDNSYQVAPERNTPVFGGRIWLLVDSEVYSAAEAFTVFCKQTGFATIVGETTGGSNSGGPILFELPNSHCLIAFDVEYCLNADGSCSQEIGTIPDMRIEDAPVIEWTI